MTVSGEGGSSDPAYAHCEAQLREGDRIAWLATLFAPADRRPGLHALGAFALDVAGIRGKVREPIAGELRIQWWIDAIEGETRGDVSGHPIATALLDTIRRHNLSRAGLTGFLEARRTDLYDEPVPDIPAFLLRADETEGALVAARLAVLTDRRGPDTEAASRFAGRAIAVLQSLRELARDASRPRVAVPVELLQAHGLDVADIRARSASPALVAVLQDFGGVAKDAMTALRRLRPKLDPAARAALLEASLVAPALKPLGTRTYDPFATSLTLPQWRAQWLLWRAAGRAGIL